MEGPGAWVGPGQRVYSTCPTAVIDGMLSNSYLCPVQTGIYRIQLSISKEFERLFRLFCLAESPCPWKVLTDV